MAAKWGQYSIRVNAIVPAWFPIDMIKWVLDQHGKKIFSLVPMGRFGEPEKLKRAVVYLASEASSMSRASNEGRIYPLTVKYNNR